MTQPTYAFAFDRTGPWTGRYQSRAEAEDAGRRSMRFGGGFQMVWTARVIELSLGDFVRGGPLLHLLSEQTDYAFSYGDWEEAQKNGLEDAVGQLIDELMERAGQQQLIPKYIERQPGFYVIDYDTAMVALRGTDTRYNADAPVQNEMHYMTLIGRINRFNRRRKRVDLEGVPLTERVKRMTRAMLEWDARFPIPGLHQYEARVREIKVVLRSAWPDLGIIPEGHDYSEGSLSTEQCDNRLRYRKLQRELRWLKYRLTEIYKARQWAKRDGKAFVSATAPSTEARSP